MKNYSVFLALLLSLFYVFLAACSGSGFEDSNRAECLLKKPCNDDIRFGVGVKTRTSCGAKWGECTVTRCDDGYATADNFCVPCIDNCKLIQKPCLISNGSGIQARPSGSIPWGDCTLTKCNQGFEMSSSGDSCVRCTNGSQLEKDCPITNGTGKQTRSSCRASWGTCVVERCNTDYNPSNNNRCLHCDTSQDCDIAGGTGKQTRSSCSGRWGPCTLTKCSGDLLVSNNRCVSPETPETPETPRDNCGDTRVKKTCSLTNAIGEQTRTSCHDSWGTCTRKKCTDATFTKNTNDQNCTLTWTICTDSIGSRPSHWNLQWNFQLPRFKKWNGTEYGACQFNRF